VQVVFGLDHVVGQALDLVAREQALEGGLELRATGLSWPKRQVRGRDREVTAQAAPLGEGHGVDRGRPAVARQALMVGADQAVAAGAPELALRLAAPQGDERVAAARRATSSTCCS
jgi:hypothetical protein